MNNASKVFTLASRWRIRGVKHSIPALICSWRYTHIYSRTSVSMHAKIRLTDWPLQKVWILIGTNFPSQLSYIYHMHIYITCKTHIMLIAHPSHSDKKKKSRNLIFPVDTKLDLGDLFLIKTKLFNARSKWEDIGLSLKIYPEKLKCIKSSNREDHDICLHEMLAHRLQANITPSLTWRVLCECLRCPTVERNDVAVEIEDWILRGIYLFYHADTIVP